jgi:hypothetical protein
MEPVDLVTFILYPSYLGPYPLFSYLWHNLSLQCPPSPVWRQWRKSGAQQPYDHPVNLMKCMKTKHVSNRALACGCRLGYSGVPVNSIHTAQGRARGNCAVLGGFISDGPAPRSRIAITPGLGESAAPIHTPRLLG